MLFWASFCKIRKFDLESSSSSESIKGTNLIQYRNSAYARSIFLSLDTYDAPVSLATRKDPRGPSRIDLEIVTAKITPRMSMMTFKYNECGTVRSA